MAGPGGTEVGRVSIRVLPDTSQFGLRLQDYLDRVESNTSIDVDIDVSTASIEAARREIASLGRSVDVRIDADRAGLSEITGSLAGMASSAAGAATGVLRMAATLGTAVPLAAGLASALAAMAPAASLAAPAILAVVSAVAAVKLATHGVSEAITAAFDPSKPEAYAEALKKLSPEAQKFVTVIAAARPQLQAFQQTIQNTVFTGLAARLKEAGSTLLPVFQKALVATGQSLNTMAAGILDTAGALGASGILGQALASANVGLRNLVSLPSQLVASLGVLAAAAGPAFERMTAAAGKGADSISAKLQGAFESGGLQSAITTAVDLIKQLGAVVANVGHIIGSVFSAAQANGGGFIGTLREITGTLATTFSSAPVQDALRALFSTMSLLAKTVAPLLGQALGALAPVLAALGPPAQDLIRTLGDALAPIIVALKPVLLAAATAVGTLVTALLPLLPVASQLITTLLPVFSTLLAALSTVFTQLAPVVALVASVIASVFLPVINALVSGLLPPLVNILTTIIGAVLPVLMSLVVALQPALATMSGAFVELVGALAPVLTSLAGLIGPLLKPLTAILNPIIEAVGKLAAIFADELANIIQTIVVPALQVVSKLLAGDFRGAFQSAKDVVKGMVGEVVRLMSELPFKILDALADLAGALVRVFVGAVKASIIALAEHRGDIKDFFSGLPGQIAGWLGDLGSLLYESGAKIITGLINGIKSRAGAVKDAVSGVLESARNLLPFSPAKEGPFSGKGWTLYSGRSISEALAQGILDGQRDVYDATNAVAATAQGNLGAITPGFATGTTTAGGLTTTPAGGPLVSIAEFNAYADQTPADIARDLLWAAKAGG